MSQIAEQRLLHDDHELYLERAEALAARRPDAKGLQATVVAARATYEARHGTPEAAVAMLDRATELAIEVDSSPLAIAAFRFNALNILSRLGRDDEALRRSGDLLQEGRDRLGALHPLTLAVAVARAQVFRSRGDWSTVEDLTRAGLDLSMHEYRPDLVVALRSSYAAALAGMQHFDEAQRVLEQVIEEASPILGRDHLQVLNARTGLAEVHIDAKNYRAASAELDPMADLAGTEIEAKRSPMQPRHRCRYWSHVALVRSAEKRHPEAVRAADLAVAICRKTAAANSTWVFTALRDAGEVYEQASHTERALACYEEAGAIAEEITVAPDELAFVNAGLARLR